LGKKFVEGVTRPLPRLHNQASSFDCDADFGSRLKMQNVEYSGRNGQHD
jgi:hypothetical protein